MPVPGFGSRAEESLQKKKGGKEEKSSKGCKNQEAKGPMFPFLFAPQPEGGRQEKRRKRRSSSSSPSRRRRRQRREERGRSRRRARSSTSPSAAGKGWICLGAGAPSGRPAASFTNAGSTSTDPAGGVEEARLAASVLVRTVLVAQQSMATKQPQWDKGWNKWRNPEAGKEGHKKAGAEPTSHTKGFPPPPPPPPRKETRTSTT